MFQHQAKQKMIYPLQEKKSKEVQIAPHANIIKTTEFDIVVVSASHICNLASN